MRLRFLAVALALLPIAANAQYQGCRQLFPTLDISTACIQVSGSNLRAPDGSKLAAGQFTLTVTDTSGNPVTYTPQGGTASTQAFVGQIVNGAVQNIGGYPFTVVNTLNASPSGLLFHFQLQSTGGSVVYQDYPLWNLSSSSGGYSLDSYVALAGQTISGMGYPRTHLSPTAKYVQTDAPDGAKPWIGSNLWRSDKTNQWTQNPSSDPNCQQGQAIVSPYSGQPYCILPENAYALPGEGFVNPSTTIPGPMQVDPLSSGGANLPHVLEMLAGDGAGGALGMPEKGVSESGGNAYVLWDENISMGRFDCLDTKYGPGGCKGSNAAQAMQDVADDMTCYQHNTGLHASLFLPPGSIRVGTPAYPTLTFPGGSFIRGAGGEGGAGGDGGTVLYGSYNNVDAVDISYLRTATCNGTVITNSLQGGSYERFGVTGCAFGGCSNVPGDSTSHPQGGPANVGIHIVDGHYWADQLWSYGTGADGIILDGLDARLGTFLASAHDFYFYFGMDASGQNYVFSSGEVHAGLNLKCGDCTFFGPGETYGTFMTLGVEYGHIFGVLWGGGTTYLGPVFPQLEEIGLGRVFGSLGGRSIGARIDGSRGEGVRAVGGQDSYIAPTVTSPCIADPTTSYYVSGAALATPGSGMTDNTYTANASSGAAQLSVVVSGGIATTVTVITNGRGYTSTPPTFTMPGGAGGTPPTFTITMTNVFANGDGTIGCVGARDSNSGGDTWDSPIVLNQEPVFGVNHSIADYYTPSNGNTFINPRGTGPNRNPLWGQNNSDYIGHNQRIFIPDVILTGGGTPIAGSIIDVQATGGHVHFQNATPTTITAINNAFMMMDLKIRGDGFTTMPTTLSDNCSAHDLLLNAGQVYSFMVTGGEFFSQPHLSQYCNPPNDDYRFTGFAALSSLPATNTLATEHVAGTIAVVKYPALPNGTFTSAGSASSFSYCFIREVWVGGGIQTDTPQCTTKTPPVTTTSMDNLSYHGNSPLNWTEYRVILQSSTDPAFSSLIGTVVDVTSPSGLPQAAIPDLNLAITMSSFSGDAVTIPSQDQGLNVTGTYAYDLGVTPPTVSDTYCTKGQFIPNNPASPTGFDYLCDSNNHWVQRAVSAWATF